MIKRSYKWAVSLSGCGRAGLASISGFSGVLTMGQTLSPPPPPTPVPLPSQQSYSSPPFCPSAVYVLPVPYIFPPIIIIIIIIIIIRAFVRRTMSASELNLRRHSAD